MKTCFKCGEIKPLEDFYKHPKTADRHLNKCKECTRADVTRHRNLNIDRIRQYDMDRFQTPERKEKIAEYIKKSRVVSAAKYMARNKFHNSIRDGKIQRPNNCEQCGKECVPHGHHTNYLIPLKVTWLCAECHREEHRRNNKTKLTNVNA